MSFTCATEQSTSFPDSDPVNNHHLNSSMDQNLSEFASTENVDVKNENMTVAELMEAYEVCISSLRKTQAQRRTSSLKRISPANFSKEARRQVPEVVIQQILSLNSLDVELYKYAQDIFAKQHKHTMQKMVGTEKQGSIFNNSYGAPLWEVLSLALSIFLILLLIFLFVNARRRRSKLKI